MKQLRKLELDKFKQMSKEETDSLSGGISITYNTNNTSSDSIKITNGGGISSPTFRF